MASLSARRIAIAASNVVSGFEGESFAGLTSAGTVVPVPATAWGVQVRGTVDVHVQVDGTANPAVIPADTNPVYGLHQAAGSVFLAPVTGTADVGLNWLLVDDSP